MRKRMITRTITTNLVSVLIVKDDNTRNDTVEIGGTFRSNKHLLKAINKKLDGEEAVHVFGVKRVERKYGMSEDDFLSIAKVLDGGDLNE